MTVQIGNSNECSHIFNCINGYVTCINCGFVENDVVLSNQTERVYGDKHIFQQKKTKIIQNEVMNKYGIMFNISEAKDKRTFRKLKLVNGHNNYSTKRVFSMRYFLKSFDFPLWLKVEITDNFRKLFTIIKKANYSLNEYAASVTIITIRNNDYFYPANEIIDKTEKRKYNLKVHSIVNKSLGFENTNTSIRDLFIHYSNKLIDYNEKVLDYYRFCSFIDSKKLYLSGKKPNGIIGAILYHYGNCDQNKLTQKYICSQLFITEVVLRDRFKELSPQLDKLNK